MKLLKRKDAQTFDEKIYKIPNPLFITSEKFWDGGISSENSMNDKAEFYALAVKMSECVKKLIFSLDEKIYVGEHYCENKKLYAHWRDLKKIELFRTVSEKIKKKKCYEISLPEDENIIDMIIESNFRYLTHVSLYLPKNNIVIQPTCHTEIIIYTFNNEKVADILAPIVSDYEDIVVKGKV